MPTLSSLNCKVGSMNSNASSRTSSRSSLHPPELSQEQREWLVDLRKHPAWELLWQQAQASLLLPCLQTLNSTDSLVEIYRAQGRRAMFEQIHALATDLGRQG